MLCELNETLPTGLTIWPRGKIDKLFRSSTITTQNEAFNKRFNFSCDNPSWALEFMNPDRLVQILRLKDAAGSDIAVSLHSDGKLYIAIHSGHDFFAVGKFREDPEALRQRFAREMKWWTEMIDLFS